MTFIDLNHYDVLQIAGADAQTFLQGQVTCDIHELEHKAFSLGACCDPKGRMVATFYLFKQQESYCLLLPPKMGETLQKHLHKYAVFSKVEMKITLDNFIVGCITSEELVAEKLIILSNKHKILINPKLEEIIYADNNSWQQQQVANGIVEVNPATSHLFTPQMIDLQNFGGVSFDKGCYVGQEVVARTEYLGKLKRHLCHATINLGRHLEIGTEIFNAKGEALGIVAAVANNADNQQELLAVIQDRGLKDGLTIAGETLALKDRHPREGGDP